jgi:hypothetical protein
MTVETAKPKPKFVAIFANGGAGTRIHRANCTDIKKRDQIIGVGSTPEGAAISSYADFIGDGEMTEDEACLQCIFNPCTTDGKA